MRAMIRRAVFPLLLVLLLAACNAGGEEVEPTPTPTATAEPSPTPAPTPTATPTPTPEPAVQRIAYIGTDGSLWIINADGSGQTRLTDIPVIGGPRWSPDGSKFAVTKSPSGSDSEGVVYIVSAGGETLLEVPAVRFVGWSPGGDMFVVARPPELDVESATLILDLEGNTVVELPESVELSFSADGRRLAFFEVIGPGGFYLDVRGVVSDLMTAEVQSIDPDEDPRGAGAGPPIFSPTSPSLLAYGNRLIDLDTGQERSLPGAAVSWSPDGQHVLLLVPETCQRAQVYNVARGSSVLEFDISLRGIGSFCWTLMREQSAWSPDSRFLATYDVPTGTDELGVLHLRDIDTGDQKTVAMDFPHSLQFSPDSRLLLFFGTDGIWVVGSDGTNLTLLAEGSRAAWQPQP